MAISLLCLLGVVAVIVIVIALKRPMWLAMLAGVVVTVLFFRLPLGQAGEAVLATATSWNFWQTMLIFYMMNFLHYAMDTHNMMTDAREQLERVCGNRRIIVSLVPVIMGLVPAASAVILAGTIVDKVCGDDLSAEDKTFVTSFLRHIPEAFIPTYSSVILAAQISGISLSSLMLGMLLVAFAMYFIVYLLYIRRIPKHDRATEGMEKTNLWDFFKTLWPLIVTLALIFAGLDVLMTTVAVVMALLLLKRCRPRTVAAIAHKSFNYNILASIGLILLFKSLIEITDLFQLLPAAIAGVRFPAILIFALVFLIGAVVTSVTTVIPAALPLAIASLPNPSLAMLVLLLTVGHAGMQMSPLHVCLAMVCDHFHTSFFNLVKRTLPVVLLLTAFAFVYYALLRAVGL